jgi:hypothetical protein
MINSAEKSVQALMITQHRKDQVEAADEEARRPEIVCVTTREESERMLARPWKSGASSAASMMHCVVGFQPPWSHSLAAARKPHAG